MKKRFLSAFLALCMVFTLLPVSAMAEEAPVMLSSTGTPTEVGTYEELVDAIVKGVENIKLIANITNTGTEYLRITGDKNITIDLNGKTLNSGDTRAIYQEGSGTLTILDNEGNGKISSNSSKETIELANNCGLIVKCGKVENTGSGHAITTTNLAGSEFTGNVTILGGLVEAKTGKAIYHLASGEIHIYGGTIKSNSGTVIYINQTSKVIIGGTAEIIGNSNSTISVNSNDKQRPTLELTGGTISNTNEDGDAICFISSYYGTFIIPSGLPVIKGGKRAVNKAPDLSSYTNVKVKASTTAADGSETSVIIKAEIDTNEKVKAYKYLKFEPAATYTITYDANGGGGSMEKRTATEGVAFTLPANAFTPPEGKHFKAWAIGSPSGPQVNAGTTHVFTENTTLYVIWEDIPIYLVGDGQTYPWTAEGLMDAMAAVEETGGTVKLMGGESGTLSFSETIVLGKNNITLDLNDQKLEYTGPSNKWGISICRRLVFTVTDSSTNKDGSYTAINRYDAAFGIYTGSSLTINSGTVGQILVSEGRLMVSGGKVINRDSAICVEGNEANVSITGEKSNLQRG